MPKQQKSKKEGSKKSQAAEPDGSSDGNTSLAAFCSQAFDRLVTKGGFDREKVNETIKAVGKSFGSPHLHLGLGIRDLRKREGLYECRFAAGDRGGLEIRMVFKKMKGKPKTLLFDFIGDHNGVKKYLKR